MSQPQVTLKKIKFSDGTEVELSSNDIIVLVGPNNSGKSAALRGIYQRLQNCDSQNPVIKEVIYDQIGDISDVISWLDPWATKSYQNPSNPHYSALGVGMDRDAIGHYWQQKGKGLQQMNRWFTLFLDTQGRLSISNSPDSIDMIHGTPVHPIHFLYQDDTLEEKVSAAFNEAFGEDMIIHRSGGSKVPLLIGKRPQVADGEDRVSKSFLRKLVNLPELKEQGDGMRSFAGILLSVSVGKENIMLIDEPEAFLHPPQAQLMGGFLVKNRRENCQIIISTHSTDILKGILNVEAKNVRILRITRDGSINNVKMLDNKTVKSLWEDPILRFSNILDGIFHDLVVVCESDSDCRFYSAIWDSIKDELPPDARPNILFTHCGGKERLTTVVKALNCAGVPIATVADFDILSSESPLRDVVNELGMDWNCVQKDWNILKTAIDEKKSDLPLKDLKREILAVLDSETGEIISPKGKENIRHYLKKNTPWGYIKAGGKSVVPSGNPTQACERLISTLKQGGLYIVETGELESFYKSEGGHGPAWVNKVVTKDINNDRGFDAAKHFVRQFPQILTQR